MNEGSIPTQRVSPVKPDLGHPELFHYFSDQVLSPPFDWKFSSWRTSWDVVGGCHHLILEASFLMTSWLDVPTKQMVPNISDEYTGDKMSIRPKSSVHILKASMQFDWTMWNQGGSYCLIYVYTLTLYETKAKKICSSSSYVHQTKPFLNCLSRTLNGLVFWFQGCQEGENGNAAGNKLSWKTQYRQFAMALYHVSKVSLDFSKS